MRLLDDIIFNLREVGDLDNAKALLENSYRNRRKNLGEDHEETQIAYNRYVDLFGIAPLDEED